MALFLSLREDGSGAVLRFVFPNLCLLMGMLFRSYALSSSFALGADTTELPEAILVPDIAITLISYDITIM